MEPTELVAFCGRYCGSCDICASNVVFGVSLLQAINAEFGPRNAAQGLGWPPMRHLADTVAGMVDAVVDNLDQFAEETFPKGCRDNCVPPCRIAACARDKGRHTCADCEEMKTCSILDEHREAVASYLASIQANGIERFAEEEARHLNQARRTKIEAALKEANGQSTL
jgi:hypothetical protein